MKTITKIISYIFAFILIIILLAGMLLSITTRTVLNKEYMIANIEKTNYYEKVKQRLISQVTDYIEQSGLEDIKIENILTVEQIKKDVDTFVTQVYNGEEITVNQNELRQQLESELEKLQQNGLTLTVVEKKSVDKVFDTIETTYASEVVYGTYSKYIESVPKIINVVNNAIPIAKIAIGISLIALIVIILLVNLKQIKNGLRYIGISVLSSGILMIGINAFAKISMDIKNLFIMNRAMSDLVINVYSNYLSKVVITGIVGVVIGIICIIIGATAKPKVEKENNE